MFKNAESIIEIANTIADIGDKSANSRNTSLDEWHVTLVTYKNLTAQTNALPFCIFRKSFTPSNLCLTSR